MNKIILGAFAVSAFSASATADLSFTNFDGSGGFNTSNGATICGVNSVIGANYDQGDQFVSASTGDVSKITVAMGRVTGTDSCTVRLYADSGSDTLGALKGSWTFSGMSNFGSTVPIVINVNPGVGLVATQKYWLIADSADDAWQAWNYNDIGGTGNHYWNNNGTDVYSVGTQSAFRIDTNPVPEPVSMIALGAGALALIRRRRSS